MLIKKYILFVILTLIIFAWTGNQLFAAFAGNEHTKCCADKCRCPESLETACKKSFQMSVNSCEISNQCSEENQPALPRNSEFDRNSYRENRWGQAAIMVSAVNVPLTPFSYYIEYSRNTVKPRLSIEWFQLRAPPVYTHA